MDRLTMEIKDLEREIPEKVRAKIAPEVEKALDQNEKLRNLEQDTLSTLGKIERGEHVSVWEEWKTELIIAVLTLLLGANRLRKRWKGQVPDEILDKYIPKDENE